MPIPFHYSITVLTTSSVFQTVPMDAVADDALTVEQIRDQVLGQTMQNVQAAIRAGGLWDLGPLSGLMERRSGARQHGSAGMAMIVNVEHIESIEVRVWLPKDEPPPAVADGGSVKRRRARAAAPVVGRT